VNESVYWQWGYFGWLNQCISEAALSDWVSHCISSEATVRHFQVFTLNSVFCVSNCLTCDGVVIYVVVCLFAVLLHTYTHTHTHTHTIMCSGNGVGGSHNKRVLGGSRRGVTVGYGILLSSLPVVSNPGPAARCYCMNEAVHRGYRRDIGGGKTAEW